MAFPTTGLRLLICEDEYLLALDLAQQLTAFGATVVSIASNATELERAAREGDANTAVLDVQLLDGEVYSIVPMLEEQGIVVAFCSAHPVSERPAQFAHLAWFDKLTPAGEIARALCETHDARSDRHYQ